MEDLRRVTKQEKIIMNIIDTLKNAKPVRILPMPYTNQKRKENSTDYKNKLSRKLKSSLFLRAVSMPYMKMKKTKDFRRYLQSEDALKIKTLRNKFENARCFVIGNGPSLTIGDLEKLEGEITFASNRIYNFFSDTTWRPVFYMAEDVDGLGEMLPHVLDESIPNLVLNNRAKDEALSRYENIYWAQWGNGNYVINRYNDKSIHFSEDISEYFSVGYTVTFSAIQLAVYMGIKEIYLLGVDFNYSVVADQWGRMKRLDGVQTYFDGKERNGSYLNYYSTLRAYETARNYCDSHGIKIANATRGGKLEVFERVDFDSLKSGRGGHCPAADCIS